MLAGLGTTEILIIAGILILLFGSTQIPKLARSLGQGKRELKRALSDIDSDQTEDKYASRS